EKEGWGLTVLEANACGVPAVASDVPGLRDAVRHEESGVLVPHGDVMRLTEAVLKILQDAGYRRRLNAGARAWAERFSWDLSSADIAAVIEAVAAATPGQASLPSAVEMPPRPSAQSGS
ncbi:MAG: glycosyltransferase, partial [Nevskiales bacterium]